MLRYEESQRFVKRTLRLIHAYGNPVGVSKAGRRRLPKLKSILKLTDVVFCKKMSRNKTPEKSSVTLHKKIKIDRKGSNAFSAVM
jgi:hypothetical protein